jgi:hypothetical protein
VKIAILYICTGRYLIFWKDFYLSCEKYFIKEAEKHYFVFTDADRIVYEKTNSMIHRIFQANLGWPNNTLRRYGMFLSIKDQFLQFDYLVYFNANLRFLKEIAAGEFLPHNNHKLIAAIHPAFYNKLPDAMPFERNPHSSAFMNICNGQNYFQGAINGGERHAFIIAMNSMDANIKTDSKKGITAIAHDESHWNRYLANRNDVKELSPSYIFPEGWSLPFEQIILSRDKDKYGGHAKLRGIKQNIFARTVQLFITIWKKLSL